MNATTVLVGILVGVAFAVTAVCLGESAGQHAEFDTHTRRLIIWILAVSCALTGILTPIVSGMINDGGLRLWGSILLMAFSLRALRIPHCAYRQGRKLRRRQRIPE